MTTENDRPEDRGPAEGTASGKGGAQDEQRPPTNQDDEPELNIETLEDLTTPTEVSQDVRGGGTDMGACYRNQ